MKNNLFKNFQNLFKKNEISNENAETINNENMLDDNSFIEDILSNQESDILIAASSAVSKNLKA